MLSGDDEDIAEAIFSDRRRWLEQTKTAGAKGKLKFIVPPAPNQSILKCESPIVHALQSREIEFNLNGSQKIQSIKYFPTTKSLGVHQALLNNA